MPTIPDQAMTMLTRVRVPIDLKERFIDWQSKLNLTVTAVPGFVSLEILSPTQLSHYAWVIVQRFSHPLLFSQWIKSEERRKLMDELREIVGNHGLNIQEEESGLSQLPGGVTEVFVTQVAPGMEAAYRKWIARIQQAEAKFPGFRGVYVQSPSPGQGRNWITLLQFDSQETLDTWLHSPERKEALQESASFVSSLESHRVVSPYAGWFSSLAKEDEVPPVWKQTMIVLLVLFPIVMLELKYLNPLIANLNSSLATFIGNAISVSLISWPMMPIAIEFLGWWLSSKKSNRRRATVWGTGLVLLLYLIEIAIFWDFL